MNATVQIDGEEHEYSLHRFPRERLHPDFDSLYNLLTKSGDCVTEEEQTANELFEKMIERNGLDYDFDQEVEIQRHGWRAKVKLDSKVLTRWEKKVSTIIADAYCCFWLVQHGDSKLFARTLFECSQCLRRVVTVNKPKFCPNCFRGGLVYYEDANEEDIEADNYYCFDKVRDVRCWRAQAVEISFVGTENDVKSAMASFLELRRKIYRQGTQKAKESGAKGGDITVFRNNYVIAAAKEIAGRIVDIPIELAPSGKKFETAMEVHEDRKFRTEMSEKAVNYNGKIGVGRQSKGRWDPNGGELGRKYGSALALPVSRSLPAPALG